MTVAAANSVTVTAAVAEAETETVTVSVAVTVTMGSGLWWPSRSYRIPMGIAPSPTMMASTPTVTNTMARAVAPLK